MNEPESGRCARCHELTVLERVPCETCDGLGVVWFQWAEHAEDQERDCTDCGGNGYTEFTPCCGRELLDEAGAVDAASDRAQET